MPRVEPVTTATRSWSITAWSRQQVGEHRVPRSPSTHAVSLDDRVDMLERHQHDLQVHPHEKTSSGRSAARNVAHLPPCASVVEQSQVSSNTAPSAPTPQACTESARSSLAKVQCSRGSLPMCLSSIRVAIGKTEQHCGARGSWSGDSQPKCRRKRNRRLTAKSFCPLSMANTGDAREQSQRRHAVATHTSEKPSTDNAMASEDHHVVDVARDLVGEDLVRASQCPNSPVQAALKLGRSMSGARRTSSTTTSRSDHLRSRPPPRPTACVAHVIREHPPLVVEHRCDVRSRGRLAAADRLR